MRTHSVFIAGAGHAGRALMDFFADGTLLPHAVCGIADSSGALVESAGIAPETLLALRGHKRAGKSLASFPAAGSPRFVADIAGAIAGSGASLLAELSPTDTETGGAALVYAKAALAAGADIVFASKGALVAAWDDLAALAAARGARMRYSATVGAGMPVVDTGLTFSAANPIQRIDAVLNGTCIHILGLMEAGMGLESALASAQAAGMAEADPSADLDGIDAAAKLCILSRAVLNAPLPIGEVSRQSLRELTPAAMAAAMERGMRVRPVASVWLEGGAPRAEVRLVEVAATSPLARSGAENAVIFHSRNAGQLALLGKGAGPRETATAVARDILFLSG